MVDGRELASALTSIVEAAAARMLTIADDVAGKPRAAGKWSRKQIVGHLIDSAVNNQARFVRAQMQQDLVFDGYDQEAWVRVQRYEQQPWVELVRAWQVYNAQVAAIMRTASPAEIDRARSPHNLDRIGFKSLPPGREATLGFLMRDYVDHLQHHVAQVLGA
ncbi:MAG: DinB family protein [Vicinamibacterales bacterium]